MPEVSRFYGIIIRMYYNDHAPPHIHAEYAESEAVFGLAPIRLLDGSAPHRVRSMVLEWIAMHQEELLCNWERCRLMEMVQPVAPLE